MIIAGSRSPFVSDKIIKMFTKEKGIRNRVSFIFDPSDEKLRDLYLRARGFLYPGVENFNMMILEAASNGCPSITCKESGVFELFEGKCEELFTEQNDIEKFAEITESLLHDEKKTISEGKKQYKVAINYTTETHMEKLIKIIGEIEI